MAKASEGHSKHKELYQGSEVHLCSSFIKFDRYSGYFISTYHKIVLFCDFHYNKIVYCHVPEDSSNKYTN